MDNVKLHIRIVTTYSYIILLLAMKVHEGGRYIYNLTVV